MFLNNQTKKNPLGEIHYIIISLYKYYNTVYCKTGQSVIFQKDQL